MSSLLPLQTSQSSSIASPLHSPRQSSSADPPHSPAQSFSNGPPSSPSHQPLQPAGSMQDPSSSVASEL